jgi:hypothetical protein
VKSIVLAALLILVPTGLSPQDTVLQQHALEHQLHWNKFFRELFGCPEDATTPKECNLALGRVDYNEFRGGCKTAKKLWGLRGECN